MSNLPNPFNTLQTLSVGGTSHRYYSLPALETAGFRISRLPVSIRLVLESLLRNCDGKRVAEHAVKALAGWQPNAPRTEEVPFVVARIVLQDFTGVPLLVDLAAMRSAVERLGKNPKIIEPLVPVDLVVDHSVQVDFAGSPQAWERLSLPEEATSLVGKKSLDSGEQVRFNRLLLEAAYPFAFVQS